MRVRGLLNSKFNTDLLWNIGSFGLSGVIGVLLNVLIYRFYDTAALGVFNQIYAIYIILSQLAVGGTQFSIQFFIPDVGEYEKKRIILITALFTTGILSMFITGIGYWGREWPGIIMRSEEVRKGFVYVLPGLIFFSFNKLLIAYLNGLRRMKELAIFQLLRFVFMLTALLTLVFLTVDSYKIAAILSIAEILLFLCLSLYNYRILIYGSFNSFWFWVKEHILYGSRVVVGNVMMDVNTRVDVFLLGIFLNDSMVGVYSFAATVAEGIYQLPILFRNNINPVLTRCYSNPNKFLLERVINRSLKSFYRVLSGLAFLSICGFPVLLWISGIESDFITTLGVYTLMILGVIMTSGYIPFQMIFNQTGKPAHQTYFYLFSFITNVSFNLLLIPVLGVYGAAIATSLVMILQVVYQKITIKKLYGIQLGFGIDL